MAKRKKAASMTELLNTKFYTMDFDGEMEGLFGKPERSGCWLVWGPSANGKTTFMLQLCRYLTKFGKVAYNSIEEGISESFRGACMRADMLACEGDFLILDKEPIDELEVRLAKRRSPDIIVIDSIQYSELNRRTAKAFVDRHPKKLFIFVSHASGKLPDGRTANAIRFHANVKIRIEGFRAMIESRYGGEKSKYYTIWKEGAQLYFD
jgi:predicted AAA+ superfamily ATPase